MLLGIRDETRTLVTLGTVSPTHPFGVCSVCPEGWECPSLDKPGPPRKTCSDYYQNREESGPTTGSQYPARTSYGRGPYPLNRWGYQENGWWTITALPEPTPPVSGKAALEFKKQLEKQNQLSKKQKEVFRGARKAYQARKASQ